MAASLKSSEFLLSQSQPYLSSTPTTYPSKAQLLACLPASLLTIDPVKAWGSLAMSLGLTLFANGVGTLIPLRLSAALLWLLYAAVTGTVAGGCWVIAHECGHRAFHPNPWVANTWLQHSDINIPHFSSVDWTWAKGAMQTVDRPCGPLLNFLHHGIGSTHVCHQVDSRIPHYNAWQATALLKQRFPALVRHDPAAIHTALWRVASRYVVVSQAPWGEGCFYEPQISSLASN